VAFLWGTGFELNSVDTREFDYGSINIDRLSISTSTKRSGAYALRLNNLGSSNASSVGHLFRTADTTPVYARFYFRLVTAPSSATTPIFALQVSSGTIRASIRLTTGGAIQLVDDTTVIGASRQLATNVWHRIEIFADSTNASGSRVITGRLDGIEFASSSTATLGTIGAVAFGGNLVGSETATGGEWFFDDIQINDTSGSVENSWPGEGRIVHARPNAAGDSNTWQTASGGSGSGSSTNYEAVNEIYPNDATTYLRRTTTTIKVDDYNITNSSDLGIIPLDTIRFLAVGARGGATSATANTARNVLLRIKGQSGGTVSKSAQIDWSVSGWITHSDPTPRNYKLVAYTNPQSSDAWSTSTLDTAQIGIENASSSTTEARVSTMWALVAYSNSTLTIRPNANGDTMQWTAEGGDYERVNESTADGDTTRLYTPTDDHVALFNFTNPTAAGVIHNVKVFVVVRGLDPVDQGTQVGVKVGSTEYWSATKSWNSTSYITLHHVWETNPGTSSAWTWSDINSLQAGLKRISGGGQAVTQVYMEILYSEEVPTTPELDQLAYRWRDDDGSESAATWLAAQNTNLTRTYGLNTRLRLQVNATNDPASAQFQLLYGEDLDDLAIVVAKEDNTEIVTRNRVLNSSFELGLGTAWAGSFGGGVKTQATDETLFGTYSLKVDADGDTIDGGRTQNLTLPAGTWWLSGWIKTSGINGDAKLVLRNTNDYAADINLTVTASTQDWTRVSGSVTIGSSTNFDIVLGLGPYGTVSTGIAWFDGIMITETSLEDYYDGSFPMGDTYFYGFSGTAHETQSRKYSLPPIFFTDSTHIGASGAATTAQLTAPSGKTTGDFTAGRIQDDENPADAVDIANNGYTELEWNLRASTFAENKTYYFRVTNNGVVLDTYTVNPQWTVGTPSASTPSRLTLLGVG
jgi:hypothetical protein